MKRQLNIPLLLSLAFALASCGGNQPSATSTLKSTTESAAPTATSSGDSTTAQPAPETPVPVPPRTYLTDVLIFNGSGKGFVILCGTHPAAPPSVATSLGLRDSDGSDAALTAKLILAVLKREPLSTFP